VAAAGTGNRPVFVPCEWYELSIRARVPRAATTSLLDDPRFLPALDRVDLAGEPEVEPPIENDVADLREDDLEPEPLPVRPPVRRPAARRAASVARVALGVAGFLMMMGVGGAAAAYVFADRVALILRR
jgi:hypothetical protein